MLSRRSWYLLSRSERVTLQDQWIRSGQCIRCFHASISRRADNQGNDQGTPSNAPKRGPTRQQRAAMISEEVKMIQRDHPSPSFGEPDPNTLRPAGASQTVDPEAVGEGVTSGRMGENDTPAQEGPFAQGVGREVRAVDDVPDTSKMARGARSPQDNIQGPMKGGTGVVEASSGDVEPGSIPGLDAGATETSNAPNRSQHQSNQAQLSSGDHMIHGKYAASTIAGSRFDRVMTEQISRVTRHQYRPQEYVARAKRQAIPKMVAGNYDPKGHLKGDKQTQQALKEIARTTSMNGTYLPADTEKFVNKVRSLLPAASASKPQQSKRQ